jgi:hypothetical protein
VSWAHQRTRELTDQLLDYAQSFQRLFGWDETAATGRVGAEPAVRPTRPSSGEDQSPTTSA